MIAVVGQLPHLLSVPIQGASAGDLHIVHVLHQDPHRVGVGARVSVGVQGALNVDH